MAFQSAYNAVAYDGNGGKMAVTATGTGSINPAGNRISDALTTLHDLLTALEGRLEPVVVQRPPALGQAQTGPQAAPTPSGDSLLAQNLSEYASSARRANDRLSALLDSLDI